MTKGNDTSGRRLAKSTVCATRRMKVRKAACARTIKDKDNSQFDRTVYTPLPWINLQGKWLELAGFAIDTPVKVRVMDGCLVLTTQPPATPGFQLFERLSEQDQTILTQTMTALVNKKTS